MLGLHVSTGHMRRYGHNLPDEGRPDDGIWVSISATDHNPVNAGRPSSEIITISAEPREDGTVFIEIKALEGGPRLTIGDPVESDDGQRICVLVENPGVR